MIRDWNVKTEDRRQRYRFPEQGEVLKTCNWHDWSPSQSSKLLYFTPAEVIKTNRPPGSCYENLLSGRADPNLFQATFLSLSLTQRLSKTEANIWRLEDPKTLWSKVKHNGAINQGGDCWAKYLPGQIFYWFIAHYNLDSVLGWVWAC